MAGFCHLWIPGFVPLAKTLYYSIKGLNEETLPWTKTQQTVFQTLKPELLSALALALINLEKHFHST